MGSLSSRSGAVHFIMLNAPALYAYTLSECLKRYLMAQACFLLQSRLY